MGDVEAADDAEPAIDGKMVLVYSSCSIEAGTALFACAPPVAAYDRAFQARLAEETQRLPPGAALERAMLDYAQLRNQARACLM